MAILNRLQRNFRFVALGLLASASLATTSVFADDITWHKATSLIGAPKYADGFPHYDYVNPDAPKGGLVRLSAQGSFDTLNVVPPKGTIAGGVALIYDTLMDSALDELSTMYPLVATEIGYPEDFSSVTFKLNPAARWHDGQPITSEDVVWSFEALTEHSPTYKNYYKHVISAEVRGAYEVHFTFDEVGNKELPHIVGQLLILPKHWWEGTDAEGNARNIAESTLETPLGSGPYRVGKVVPGRTLELERVDDYWGADLPINVGKYNFDAIRYEYFRDDTVRLEAFKSDDYDFRVENTARIWATGYDIAPVADGRIKLEEFDERGQGIMVGFIPNQRREKFQDQRVRRALNLAYNFEEMNRTIFFGAYTRIDSYFYGDELASDGLPTGQELAILEEVRAAHPDHMPERIFLEEYTNPIAADTGGYRNNLREAVRLFRAAGYRLQDGKMVDGETGEPFTIEVLLNGARFESIALRLKTNFERIGVGLTVRIVDSSQWVNRVRGRDFDMIYNGWLQSMSPGNEQLEYFGSAAADQESSRNWGGVKDPAVDALIQKIIFAKDREELIAATKAMDRVLLAKDYIIPGWTLLKTRTARWDRFSHPDTLPLYNEPAFPTIWWYDEAKAVVTGAAQ